MCCRRTGEAESLPCSEAMPETIGPAAKPCPHDEFSLWRQSVIHARTIQTPQIFTAMFIYEDITTYCEEGEN